MLMDWDDIYRAGKGLRWWPNTDMLAFIAREFPDCAEARVLEIGCGNGPQLWALCDQGFWRVSGIDVSPIALEIAAGYLAQRGASADLIQGSALKIPYEGALFDLVVDVQCLQHLTADEHPAAYAEVARVLKPGGRFFSVHLARDTYRYERLFPDTPPAWLASRNELQRAMEQGGLRADAITYTLRTYPSHDVAVHWIAEAGKA